MKVGTRTQEQEKYVKQKAERDRILQQAIELAETRVKLDNLPFFRESFTEEFKRLWTEQHSGSFPPFVTTEKQIEMSEFSLSMLSSLEAKYKDIRLPEKPNFDITITEEQIPTYKSLKSVCDSLNASKKYVSNLMFGDVVRMYRGAITYNFQTQQLEVNPHWFSQSRDRVF
jgi:hypothetical protein